MSGSLPASVCVFICVCASSCAGSHQPRCWECPCPSASLWMVFASKSVSVCGSCALRGERCKCLCWHEIETQGTDTQTHTHRHTHTHTHTQAHARTHTLSPSLSLSLSLSLTHTHTQHTRADRQTGREIVMQAGRQKRQEKKKAMTRSQGDERTMKQPRVHVRLGLQHPHVYVCSNLSRMPSLACCHVCFLTRMPRLYALTAGPKLEDDGL